MVTSEGPIRTLSLPGALQVRHFAASVGAPRHVALAELAWDGTRGLPAPQPRWFMRLYRSYGT